MGIIGREGSQGFPLGWKDPEPAVPRAGPLHCCLPVSWRVRLHLPCRRGRRGTRRDALADPGGRDLLPRGQHQPGACPSPTQPFSWGGPPGPCPGCLCRAEPSSPRSGEAAGTVPTPWAGRLAGAGRGQLERDSRPGSSITLGCHSGFEGVSRKGELRHLGARRACYGGSGEEELWAGSPES